MSPAGQWLRSNGYDKSTDGFGNIDPGYFSSFITLGEKSQNTHLLTETKLSHPQSSSSHPCWIDLRLYPEKALGLHDLWDSC